MTQALIQQANDFLRRRLGERTLVLGQDSSDTEILRFMCASCDHWATTEAAPELLLAALAGLRSAQDQLPMVALPISEVDHLIAVKLDTREGRSGVCLSFQQGPADLAKMAVANACEAWNLTRELSLGRRAAAVLQAQNRPSQNGSGLRGDKPHLLERPHLESDGTLDILRAMSSAIDFRDKYTHGHSLRVANLAHGLATQLGLNATASREIYWAGILHDIGKIGIPDVVLLKESELSASEYAVVQGHPEIGYRIVERVKHLHFALPGILYHHERWDGQGYPHGLRGESIPLMARVLAVADAFDAMTSCRVYRRPVSPPQALQTINAGCGVQWDRRVATGLQALLEARRPAEPVAAIPA